MTNRRSGLHTLVGAYVLDSVTDQDRAGFERHLPTCEQCREDVRGLREASARLAAAAAMTPRPALRQQMLQAVAATRQVPPAVEGEGPARLPRRPVSGTIARHPWLVGFAAGLAAVLAVTAVLVGVHAGAMQRRLTAQQQRDSALTAVLGAHDAIAMTAAARTGGSATVVMSHHARALVFTAAGLAPLPGTRAYELWLAGPAGVRPAGMLAAGPHGMSGPMVVGGLTSGEQIELTVEPATGSRQPTSVPIVSLGLGS